MPTTIGRPAASWLAPALALACLLLLPVAAAAGAEPSSQLLAQADASYQQREDPVAARRAIALYRQVLELQPGHEEAACRLARVLVWLGTMSPDSQEEREYYRQATQAAEAAAKALPGRPGPHYWRGVGLGLSANCVGPLEGVFLIQPVKDEMAALLKLDPGYEHAGAYRVLGRLFTKLPALLGGDLNKAEEYLRLAVKQAPRYWLNHLYLAAVLMEKGQLDEAAELVRQVKDGEPVPGEEAESREWRKAASEALTSGRLASLKPSGETRRE